MELVHMLEMHADRARLMAVTETLPQGLHKLINEYTRIASALVLLRLKRKESYHPI